MLCVCFCRNVGFFFYSINPIYTDLKCTVKIDELLLVYCGGMEDLLRILSMIVGFFFGKCNRSSCTPFLNCVF